MERTNAPGLTIIVSLMTQWIPNICPNPGEAMSPVTAQSPGLIASVLPVYS